MEQKTGADYTSRWERFSLAPRERAGVRGNATPLET